MLTLSGFVLIYLGIGALIAVGFTLMNIEDAKMMEPTKLIT